MKSDSRPPSLPEFPLPLPPSAGGNSARPGKRVPLIVLAAAVLSAGMSGCRSGATIGDEPAYPDLKQARVLDVQVVRDETRITFTNTSAEAFPACRMWVNRWWSREIAPLDVGATASYDLRDFKDTYGDPFRAGGFFATEAPDKLVQAQIELNGEMVGLIVIGQ